MRQFDHNGLMLAEYKENYLNDQMNWIVQQRYLLEDFYIQIYYQN